MSYKCCKKVQCLIKKWIKESLRPVVYSFYFIFYYGQAILPTSEQPLELSRQFGLWFTFENTIRESKWHFQMYSFFPPSAWKTIRVGKQCMWQSLIELRPMMEALWDRRQEAFLHQSFRSRVNVRGTICNTLPWGSVYTVNINQLIQSQRKVLLW